MLHFDAKCLAAALVVIAVTGCGSPSDETPSACLSGPNAYQRALATAPGQVTLPGGVPISDCLAENQRGGDLARAGESMVVAATRLNLEGRAAPRGPAPLRLGYLVGAAERGAANTGGIHADLVRRMTSAARSRRSGTRLPPAYLRAYRRGVDAGNAGG